ELGHARVRARVRRFLLGDIGVLEEGLTAGGDDLVRHPLAALGRHVGHHDLRALSRECLGVLLADAAGCAGHDRGPPVETSHVAAPPTSSPVVGWVCCACRASGLGGRRLDLEVLLESLPAPLAADAGLLVAAERAFGAVPLAAVDAERPGADPCDDLLDALVIGA